MHFFLDKTKKRSFIRSRHFFNIVFIIFIFVLIIGSMLFVTPRGKIDSSDIIFGLFFILCFLIALSLFLPKHKAFGDFTVDEEGIRVDDRIYHWEKLKHYHWLGELQNEKTGVFGIRGIGYDPTNPYKYADTRVARIKVRESWRHHYYLNLEIDKEKTNDLANILEQRGIKYLSKWRQFAGI